MKPSLFEIWTHNPPSLHVVVHDHTDQVTSQHDAVSISPLACKRPSCLPRRIQSSRAVLVGTQAGSAKAGAKAQVSREDVLPKEYVRLAFTAYTQQQGSGSRSRSSTAGRYHQSVLMDIFMHSSKLNAHPLCLPHSLGGVRNCSRVIACCCAATLLGVAMVHE